MIILLNTLLALRHRQGPSGEAYRSSRCIVRVCWWVWMVHGYEVRLCDPCATACARVHGPCVSCVSRLPLSIFTDTESEVKYNLT